MVIPVGNGMHSEDMSVFLQQRLMNLHRMKAYLHQTKKLLFYTLRN